MNVRQDPIPPAGRRESLVRREGRIDRRRALALLSAVVGAPVAVSDLARAAEVVAADGPPVPEPDLETVLPFRRSGISRGRREVFAHWHFFAISMDDRPAHEDYYAVNFLSPRDASGKAHDYGGAARERPLPRSPRRIKEWAVADMERDIRWAREIGIDAFLYNVITIDPGPSQFWQVLLYMLKAAENLGGAFRIVPNLDATLLASQPVKAIAAALQSIGDHPMWLRRPGGELVLGAFAAERWPAARWAELFDELGKVGIRVEFMPTFLNVGHASSEHWRLTIAASEWGGNYLDALPNVEAACATVRRQGKAWCSPVWPQDCRPKNGAYAEAANSRLFREGWMSAIGNGAEGVQLITWNDYSESSAVRPSTCIQYSFYDLAAYYIEWFKAGAPPKITRDVLYYFHRTQPTSGASLGTSQVAAFALKGSRASVNEIELLAFLVDAGELQIEIGDLLHRMDATAGVVSMRVPVALGRPVFRLKRGNRTIVDLESAFAIEDTAAFQDLVYHGGSSSRPPVTRE